MILQPPAALFCGLLLFSNSPSFAEEVMDVDPLNTLEYHEFRFARDHRLIPFKEEIGYDRAIVMESRDGLIDIDFRELKVPEFIKKVYPFKFGRDDEAGGHYWYDWGVDGSGKSGATIEVKVGFSYETARIYFMYSAQGSSMPSLPYGACKRKIGTACGETWDKEIVFFLYKNVAIEVRRHREHLPGYEEFGEDVAEWLYDALRVAPLRPFHEGISERPSTLPETSR